MSAGEIKWYHVIQNKLIGLIQTVHFGMSFCDHQVFPTSPLTHHTCSPKSCQVDMLRQAYKHTVSQCSLSSMRQQTGTGVHECVCVHVCVWEREKACLSFFVHCGWLWCFEAAQWPHKAVSQWEAVSDARLSFVYSCFFHLVLLPLSCSPPPQHVPSYFPQSPPSRLPFCNCSGIYWQRPEWSSVYW